MVQSKTKTAVKRIVKSQMPNGVIIYRGPSMLDGKPIIVVATGLVQASSNDKTGKMIQTYIMPDQDLKPSEATKANQDTSVCGDCPHKGDHGKMRTCYVNLGQGPRSVWLKATGENPYPIYNPTLHAHLFTGRKLRFGTWGDPAAVPVTVWRQFTELIAGWTGYTHQELNDNEDFRELCMASCDSVDDVLQAWLQGWRTFRVKDPSEPLIDGEISCPASEEAGKVTNCERCGLCAGASVGDATVRGIAINAHGGFGVMAAWRKKQQGNDPAPVALTIRQTS